MGLCLGPATGGFFFGLPISAGARAGLRQGQTVSCGVQADRRTDWPPHGWVKPPYRFWLLPGFGVVTGTSGDEARDEGAEESFAPAACVVHELEEAEIERQLVLRDAPVRAEPGAQQGPEPLDGVDVHFAEAVPVLVAGVFAAPVADRFVLIAPGGQAGVNAIRVGMDEGTLGNRGRDDRL